MSRRQQYHVINKSSAVTEMGDRLAVTDMGRKIEAAVPFSGPHLKQCGLGRGLPPYRHLDPSNRLTIITLQTTD